MSILAITLISTGIPYALFTSLLQGTLGADALVAAKMQFVSGYRLMALVLGIVSVISIVPSVFRAKDASEVLERVPKPESEDAGQKDA